MVLADPNTRPTRDGVGVVDVHIHAIPPLLVQRIRAGDFADVGILEEGAERSFSFPGMAPSPPAPPGLFDFDALASRRIAGVDVQMISPWTDLLGYTLPRTQAARWARIYNETLAASCAEHRGLVPMATIPMQFPHEAVRELETAHSAGCRGVVLGSDIPPNGIDDPELDRVWEAAEGLSMPLLIHPTFIQIPIALRSRGLKNAVGRAAEGLVRLTRFIYSGALDRYPGLRVIGALGGCGLVPLRRRIARNHQLGWSQSSVDLEASLGRLHYDSIVLDPHFLRYLVGEVGADRVMLGSDYPFPWEPDPIGFVAAAGLGPDDTAAVLGGTAANLFGLS